MLNDIANAPFYVPTVSILGSLGIIFTIAIISYVPLQLAVMRHRTAYYLWGSNATHRLEEFEKKILRWITSGGASHSKSVVERLGGILEENVTAAAGTVGEMLGRAKSGGVGTVVDAMKEL